MNDYKSKSGGKPGVPSGAAPLGWKPTFPTEHYTVGLSFFLGVPSSRLEEL